MEITDTDRGNDNYQSNRERKSGPSLVRPNLKLTSEILSNKPTRVPTKSPILISSTKLPSRASSLSPLSVTSRPSKPITSTVLPSKSPSSTTTIVPTKLIQTTTRTSAQPTQLPSSTVKPKVTSSPTRAPIATVPHADDITYHNGSVMVGPVNIYHIYMGSFSPTTVSLMNYFAANIGSSSWYEVLGEYSQTVKGVKTAVPTKNSVFFKGNWTHMPNLRAQTITDEDIYNAIGASLKNTANPMPLNSANGIYFIFLRGDFIYPGWNDESLKEFCSYHTILSYFSQSIKVVFIGDPSTSVPRNEHCIGYDFIPLANGDLGADSMVTTYAHQLAEVITNYDGKAWYRDRDGQEIADICNFDFQTLSNSNVVVGSRRFLVQALFQPGVGCVLKKKTVTAIILMSNIRK
eukprot:CAMPEP_0170073534 /NCGR_PEP_ID=MMETSP0019_2-20121128/10929_1 /TAXON_ID=98059 /ORGANISM="Dinobryon sp., Strain UTEXLB2267" /LENGTH=404 /DNA_ID=CAMNT_0010283115 /DNA_START=133 /DNA_END=1347 /DNA_ORIENTATION=-